MAELNTLNIKPKTDIRKIEEYLDAKNNPFHLVTVAIINIINDEFEYTPNMEETKAKMKYREEQLMKLYLNSKYI